MRSRCRCPSTSSTRSILVSLVARWRSAPLRHLHAASSASTSRSAASNASSSSGVPTVIRRQFVERGQREVAHEDAAVDQALARAAWPSPSTRTSTKLAPDGYTVSPGRRARAPTTGAARSRASRRARASPRRSAAPRCPASWVAADRWYGSTTFSSSLTSGAGPTTNPSRSAASDHTFEYVRTTTSGTSSATSSSALQLGELAVRLVDHEQARPVIDDRGEQRLDRRRAFDRARRVVRAAQEHDRRSLGRDQHARLGRRDREVGGALPGDDLGAGDAGDVRVQRVGRLEHERASTRRRRR